MRTIAQERCFNHGRREAVARCPGCGRFFCRECVTEHEGKVSCTRCLAASGEAREVSRLAAALARLCPPVGGLLLLWLLFYYLGEGLLRIPTSFHEGTFWK